LRQQRESEDVRRAVAEEPMASVQRVDHIAIAVRSIDESRKAFETIYGATYLGQRENSQQHYIVAYFLMGESLITMLEGTSSESFVTQHIEKRGEGIQHMGVEVDDFDAFIAHAEAEGARVSNVRTLEGIRKEALISPKSAFGIILQPIEWLGDLKTMPHHERIIQAGGL
jgi:methylmalonyl-CoA/ethylmalonyl-CoA epimerase